MHMGLLVGVVAATLVYVIKRAALIPRNSLHWLPGVRTEMAGQALVAMAGEEEEEELMALDMVAAQWRNIHAEAVEPVIVYMVFDAMAAKKQSLGTHKNRVWWDRYSALRVSREEIVGANCLFVMEVDSCPPMFFVILEER
jgi:hypothetical protein